MRTMHLFAGAGGGILADLILGHNPVCAVEIDPYCRGVLLARQRDGFLPRFPIWDDVRTFDGRPWRGRVEVVSGGFPCQDISSAGRGAGLAGSRSGLWFEFERIIGEVTPPWVFIENSPWLRTRGLGRVLEGLARLGYDAKWGVLGASAVGAPHIRKRMWIVAHANGSGQRGIGVDAEVARASAYEGTAGADFADADCAAIREQPGRSRRPSGAETAEPGGSNWWPVACVPGVDDGVAHRMDRVRATGNGQVPAVAALAWEALKP